MKEHPILFSTPMVLALLEGRKTQTRRIVKFPKDYTGGEVYLNGQFGLKYESSEMGGTVQRLRPKWEAGDILWVRETWNKVTEWDGCGTEPSYYDMIGEERPDHLKPKFIYKADGNALEMHDEEKDEPVTMKWKPPIFMPRKACRITMEVMAVTVQRLQGITEGDSIAEGIDLTKTSGDWENPPSWVFQELWASINGQESWDKNPWVWRIEFKKINS